MSTDRAHLENFKKDLARDFKDTNKKYTEQLVKVKVCLIHSTTPGQKQQVICTDVRHGEQ